jgi:MFS family permease
MANGVAIAALLADLFGALLLAWTLVFERAKDYVTMAVTAYGYNPRADVARAKETAQALAGLVLLGVGFAGQLSAAAGLSSDPGCPRPYGVAAGAIILAYGLVPVERRRRERNIIGTRLAEAAKSGTTDDVWRGYAQALARRGEGPAEAETLRQWAEQRYGRRFCASDPPPADGPCCFLAARSG